MSGLRLVVRTPGFHPGNRGSIPLGRTKIKTEYKIFEGTVSEKFSK